MIKKLREVLCGCKNCKDVKKFKKTIQELIEYFIEVAWEEKAEHIVFGEPVKPCKIKEEKQSSDFDFLKEDIDKLLEESFKKMGEKKELNDKKYFKVMPVWYFINGEYSQKVIPFPSRIFTSVIDQFIEKESDGILMDKNDKNTRVRYSVKMGENYCYHVIFESEQTEKNKNQV